MIGMDTMTSLRERLAQLEGSQIVRLSASSGVPYNTILNIKKGVTADPRISTVQALSAALRKMRIKVAA